MTDRLTTSGDLHFDLSPIHTREVDRSKPPVPISTPVAAGIPFVYGGQTCHSCQECPCGADLGDTSELAREWPAVETLGGLRLS